MGNLVRTALVTGSTDGIGKETAKGLLRKGLRVIVHGRSAASVARAVDELAASGEAAALEGWACDLSSLAEVRARGAELLARHPRLDVLLHNAGVYANRRAVTVDGFELTFAVSHLAPFLLTHTLLPALRAAAPARVILVSSQVHQGAGVNWSDLQLSRGYSAYGAYGQAKLCNVLFANGLAARFAPETLTANSLHPGVVTTKLLRGFGMGSGPDSLEEGARTSIHLATSPEVALVTGRYFARSQEATCSREARSTETRERLWTLSEELTEIRY